MIRLLIAEDHQMVAEALVCLLGDDMTCCGIARTIAETARMMAEQQPDVLLLDISFPDGDGIDAISDFTAQSPSTRILMLTMYAEAAVVQRAMRGGAHGYLLKNSNKAELVKGIRKVASGETYICQEAQAIIDNQQGRKIQELTPREREVLRLTVAGKSTKEIADELCLSFETIHTYSKYLRQKLGCNSTASLVRIAIERHLA